MKSDDGSWQDVVEKRRAIALARHELAALSRTRTSAAMGYATATQGEAAPGLGEADAHAIGVAALAQSHGLRLKAAREEAIELEQRVGSVMPIEALALLVSVEHLNDVALAQGAPDAVVCIALGAERVVGSPATFEYIASGAVETIDIELWDAEATHMIGHASLSIGRVLSSEISSLQCELLVGMVGREPVGTVRVAVEAFPLSVPPAGEAEGGDELTS